MSLEEVRTYLNQIRRDFADRPLTETESKENPFDQYAIWFEEAVNCQILDPYAAVISTVDEDSRVSSRVVYIRDVSEDGFVFYTNYLSKKGSSIESNVNGAFNIHWGELERQIRIEGVVEKVAEAQSDKYFNARPRESQIGAWASEQSTEIESREVLEKRLAHFNDKFKDAEVPRPPHWGGYILKPTYIEFWQGRPSRLHDRIIYKLNSGKWERSRLAP